MSQPQVLLGSCPRRKDHLALCVLCRGGGQVDTHMPPHQPLVAVVHQCASCRVCNMSNPPFEFKNNESASLWTAPNPGEAPTPCTLAEREQGVPTDWTVTGTDRPIWVLHPGLGTSSLLGACPIHPSVFFWGAGLEAGCLCL